MRIYIPNKLIYPLLEYEHTVNSFNHPGAQLMIQSLTSKYFWPQMNKDIIHYVQQCHTCQLGKGAKKHKIGKLQPTEPTYYGHTVHCDYAGPFWQKVSILVCVCATTGVTELRLCWSQTAENIANTLLQQWIPRHGIPVKIITDRGSGFVSVANKVLNKALGINNALTSAYHPQTNAKAERVVQELKKALRMINIDLDNHFTDNKKVQDPKKVKQLIHELNCILPSIQFALNQRISPITQTSPNMLIYGRNLRDKLDAKLAMDSLDEMEKLYDKTSHFEIVKQVKALIKTKMERFKQLHLKYRLIMKKDFNFGKENDHFQIGDLVAYYVGDRANRMKTIRRRFSGPWRIVERIRHNTVRIENEYSGETLACHTSMLKLYRKRDFISQQDRQQTQHAKDSAKYLNAQ